MNNLDFAKPALRRDPIIEPGIRNPNSRSPKEGRNPKPEMGLGSGVEKVFLDRRLERELSGFGLRDSFGSRISNFGFRVEHKRARDGSRLARVPKAKPVSHRNGRTRAAKRLGPS